FRHLCQILVGREIGVVGQVQAGAGDIDGEVADPLQVGGRLEGGADGAQVFGDRLLEREQAHAPGLDVQVQAVGQVVQVDDFLRQVLVLRVEGQHRLVEHLLDHAAEADD